ncbi:MAG: GGDEF domain-containing protein [Sulfuritalea sp.]|jgi:diguanylate cyclase (GGDEF)-like protein|nr:GGDEF domain-containing protein [Sulfuritalea sp.]MBK8758932.1 GGDEF domain-containing protein [Sulfuritalea sp.]MBK9348976.1 GGDEF domain-containing protein [Sulfuritalea sp.]MBP6636777.1 GGDEF domain-containing protein [Sulfuritalea sp.]MBP7422199.1 GGDEF domain-containing protein [Sulfuritalea sp.]
MTSIDREKETTSIEQEELRGIARSVGEIEWLLMIVVLLYHAFGGIADEDQPTTVLAMVIYAACIMGFRYANFFKHETRWKLAVETWIMTAFITWTLLYTGRLESPLLNSYLLVIITSALALGKLTTLLELALIGACIVMLGEGDTRDILTLTYAAGLFAQFAPFVLVAYITTMFASDIRYGLNQVKLLAETDELTKAYNRRGFAIIADRLFGQAARYKRPLSMLVLDCDNLKQVNDAIGHKAGDALLVGLVKCVQGHLRHTDILVRHGGDEFIVLLPETPAAGAVDAAEKIRAAVAENALAIGGQLVKTSVSIGVSGYPEDGSTLDLLLAHADRNMYQAKLGGRNRVVYQSLQAASASNIRHAENSA